MAAPIVAIAIVVARAFAEKLAQEIGQQAGEALFHQGQIADNLEEIKTRLNAIAAAIAQLPGLMYETGKRVAAEAKIAEVLAHAVRVDDSRAYLAAARDLDEKKTPDKKEQVLYAQHNLRDRLEDLFIEITSMAQYGQAYYLAVLAGLVVATAAYADLVDVDTKSQVLFAKTIKTVHGYMRGWVDPSIEGSFGKVKQYQDSRFQLAMTILSAMDATAWHIEQRYVLSWTESPSDDGSTAITCYGCWFSYNVGDNHQLQGDEPLGYSFTAAGGTTVTRELVLAEGAKQRFRDPGLFWTLAKDADYRNAYDTCVARLGDLIQFTKAYPSLSALTNRHFDAITAATRSLDQVIGLPQLQASVLLDGAMDPISQVI